MLVGFLTLYDWGVAAAVMTLAYFHFPNYSFLEISNLENGNMPRIFKIEICSLHKKKVILRLKKIKELGSVTFSEQK